MIEEKIYSMKSVAKELNDLTFTDYYMRLTLLARSMFQWCGLPNGISEKWIERYLFNEGCCIFFKDKEKGFMVAKTTMAGNLNYYDEPTKLQVIATNYNQNGKKYTNFEDCVLIQNNDLRLPTYPTIRLFAYRLAEITRTADININAQKTPILITGSNKKILSLKTVYKQWAGSEPVVFTDEQADIKGSINVLNTSAPMVFPELRIEKNHIWNECMTFLGINNANMDKRERLVDDEVQANNEQIRLSAEIMLKARQEACKLINDMFSLNISVKLREFKEPPSEPSEPGSEGGDGIES